MVRKWFIVFILLFTLVAYQTNKLSEDNALLSSSDGFSFRVNEQTPFAFANTSSVEFLSSIPSMDLMDIRYYMTQSQYDQLPYEKQKLLFLAESYIPREQRLIQELQSEAVTTYHPKTLSWTRFLIGVIRFSMDF